MHRTVNLGDDVHGHMGGTGIDSGMQSPPNCFDPTADAATETGCPRARTTENHDDIGTAVAVKRELQIVDVRDFALVAVDNLAVEEQQTGVDAFRSLHVRAPAFVAIISGIAANAAVTTTSSMMNPSTFDSREFVLSPM